MIVGDTILGDETVLQVDRKVSYYTQGEWTVVIRIQRQDSWEVYCTASGKTDYLPGESLPQHLTLDWWTNGQCELEEMGRYFISTIWAIHPRWAGMRRTPPLISNTFAVVDVPDDGLPRIVEP